MCVRSHAWRGLVQLALVVIVAACTQGPPAPVRPRTVVLVSLDGFRPDYLDRPAAVRLRELAAHGVRARWLRPVAPTLTFPNHTPS